MLLQFRIIWSLTQHVDFFFHYGTFLDVNLQYYTRVVHTIKEANALMLIFVHTMCHNCDVFRTIFTIYRELLNIYKTHMDY